MSDSKLFKGLAMFCLLFGLWLMFRDALVIINKEMFIKCVMVLGLGVAFGYWGVHEAKYD